MLHKFLFVAARRGPSGMIAVRSMSAAPPIVIPTPNMSPAELSATLLAAPAAEAQLAALLKARPAKQGALSGPEFTRNLKPGRGLPYIALACGIAVLVASTYFYIGCYKEVNEYQTFFRNLDNRARAERISANANHHSNKMEYWWRTGIWVGAEKAPLPADHTWKEYDIVGREKSKIVVDEDDEYMQTTPGPCGAFRVTPGSSRV